MFITNLEVTDMTAMMYTAFFFLVVGGAAIAMIAANEYYERKNR